MFLVVTSFIKKRSSKPQSNGKLLSDISQESETSNKAANYTHAPPWSGTRTQRKKNSKECFNGFWHNSYVAIDYRMSPILKHYSVLARNRHQKIARIAIWWIFTKSFKWKILIDNYCMKYNCPRFLISLILGIKNFEKKDGN